MRESIVPESEFSSSPSEIGALSGDVNGKVLGISSLSSYVLTTGSNSSSKLVIHLSTSSSYCSNVRVTFRRRPMSPCDSSMEAIEASLCVSSSWIIYCRIDEERVFNSKRSGRY